MSNVSARRIKSHAHSYIVKLTPFVYVDKNRSVFCSLGNPREKKTPKTDTENYDER